MSILHPQEQERLRVLHALALLDTAPEPEFDTAVAIAKQLLDCKTAFLSLVDADRQWFKATSGSDVCETGRDVSFCTHAVAADAPLVVPDTLADARFADNPLVTGSPHIRFYAGVPLRARARVDGPLLPVGTLCVTDDRPHRATDQFDLLVKLACVVEALFESRRASREGLRLALDRHDALVVADRSRRQLAQAERMANVGSWRLDLATSYVAWSDQTYAIHGLSPCDGEALGAALDFYPPADRARLTAAVAACAERGVAYDLELDFVEAHGLRRRVRAIGEPEMQGGERVAIIGVVQDVTERHRREQEMRASLATDELTRIGNRRAFNQALDDSIGPALAAGEPMAVALIDLDHFKAVNDQLGHPAGDEVLRAAATTLSGAAYLGDAVAARLGGDEFALLLRGPVAAEGLVDAVERLLADLVQVVPGPVDALTVSATIGVSRLNPGLPTRSALLKAADQALYRAKKHRRGTAAIAGVARSIAARSGTIAAAA